MIHNGTINTTTTHTNTIMNTNMLIQRQTDLVNNPSARIPVCLCLDTSSSMGGDPIRELNEGVRLFYESLKEDEVAFSAAEIAIVTFGNEGVKCLADFAGLGICPDPPELYASGMTPMGEAVNLALDLLEGRKAEYRKNGVDYYQPWLVLMTDGGPNGSYHELQRAKERTRTLEANRKLTLFPLGIGECADMEELSGFTRKRPLRLRGLRFKEFFAWLSQSVSVVSASSPGDTSVRLDTSGIQEWGEL